MCGNCGTKELDEAQEANLIDCIGKDNLRHVCVSWEDETICGVEVKHKNPNLNMLVKYTYSCWSCTY